MSKQQPDLQRRNLLKTLTVGGTAGVAIVATGIKVAHATATPSNISNTQGYQETAHVRSFYDSLRG